MDLSPARSPSMTTPDTRLKDLFEAHGRFVYRVARRLGAPVRDVEDLTQEVFLVAYRKLDEFDGVSPRGWLFQITSRVTADYRKRACTQHEVLGASAPDERAPSVDGQERSVWVGQLRMALDDALDTLTEEQREVFTLHELEGLPMRECAALIPCPEQTGYSRVNAARKKIRRFLCTQSDIVHGLSLKGVG